MSFEESTQCPLHTSARGSNTQHLHFLKSHFAAKRVDNYYYYYHFINQPPWATATRPWAQSRQQGWSWGQDVRSHSARRPHAWLNHRPGNVLASSVDVYHFQVARPARYLRSCRGLPEPGSQVSLSLSVIFVGCRSIRSSLTSPQYLALQAKQGTLFCDLLLSEGATAPGRRCVPFCFPRAPRRDLVLHGRKRQRQDRRRCREGGSVHDFLWNPVPSCL